MSFDTNCEYLIVSCMDYRIQGFLYNWAEKYLQGRKYDYVGFAGSTKELDIILTQIDVSINLHGVKSVLLIHHEDCGAYGVQSSLQKHIEELRKAEKEIHSKYPDLEIKLFYLTLSGNFSQIE